MDLWDYVWIAWGLFFAAAEGIAIWQDAQDTPNGERTLSNHLQEWLRTDTKRGRWVWLTIWGVFGAWFAIHIGIPGSI